MLKGEYNGYCAWSKIVLRCRYPFVRSLFEREMFFAYQE